MVSMAISFHSTLLPGPAYLADLTERITKAKTRVSIVSMLIHNDSPRMEAFIQALCDAAARGVTVTMCADTFTYLEPNSPLTRFVRGQSSQAYRALATARRLRSAGVEFRWLGRHANVGVMGRTHAKWSIVDNTVYAFGGVNLYEMGIDNTDYMLRVTDHTLADTLSDQMFDLIRSDRGNHADKNRTISLGRQTTMMLDGGITFNSYIQRRAITLASQATSIIFVSQYCPSGKLGRILREKKAKVYFNHWDDAPVLSNFVIRFGVRSSRLKTRYKRSPYLHAKFILFTMPDGSKIALTGSHNFAAGGVMLGTREICLETSNPRVIEQIEQFYEQYVR